MVFGVPFVSLLNPCECVIFVVHHTIHIRSFASLETRATVYIVRTPKNKLYCHIWKWTSSVCPVRTSTHPTNNTRSTRWQKTEHKNKIQAQYPVPGWIQYHILSKNTVNLQFYSTRVRRKVHVVNILNPVLTVDCTEYSEYCIMPYFADKNLMRTSELNSVLLELGQSKINHTHTLSDATMIETSNIHAGTSTSTSTLHSYCIIP